MFLIGKGDKLTKYNNQNLTYDSIGNPLTYRDGMTMQWLVGRQLYKVNISDDIVKFTYNADGLQTSKESNDYTAINWIIAIYEDHPNSHFSNNEINLYKTQLNSLSNQN